MARSSDSIISERVARSKPVRKTACAGGTKVVGGKPRLVQSRKCNKQQPVEPLDSLVQSILGIQSTQFREPLPRHPRQHRRSLRASLVVGEFTDSPNRCIYQNQDASCKRNERIWCLYCLRHTGASKTEALCLSPIRVIPVETDIAMRHAA